ncbi:TetR/AcrR family transcriptional regulator [Antrihabitans sp. NCIMB 15449]|uniref:TetR/AcrR family transcriptional regulator n=1 Tax=Antrihabitans spumae TaxID=3373370 RepID=A0ABW7JXH2_9NOCA
MVNRPTTDERSGLVASALTIAERKGIDAVSVASVADELGIPIETMRACFADDEALLGALAESMVLRLSSSMHAALSAAAESADVRGERGLRILVHSGLSAMWQIIEATPAEQILSYEFGFHSMSRGGGGGVGAVASLPFAAEQYRVMDSEATTFLTECARRTGTTWLEPVPAIARFGVALLDGLVRRWLVDHRSEAMIAQLDDLAGIIASKAIE